MEPMRGGHGILTPKPRLIRLLNHRERARGAQERSWVAAEPENQVENMGLMWLVTCPVWLIT